MMETALAKSALSIAVLGAMPQDGPYRYNALEAMTGCFRLAT